MSATVANRAPMQPAPPIAVLLVDDDHALRERLARAFRDRGLETFTAAGFDDAVSIAAEHHPDLAVVDLRMPGRTGLELLRALREIDPAIRVVVLTGYGSIATAIEATRLGAAYYLPKPADAEDILAAFGRADPPSEVVADVATAPSLARAEWEHIQRVLTDCDNNVSEAARRLGVHRRSLQRKLQKYPPRS
jgi:two-component system response regulator RegA